MEIAPGVHSLGQRMGGRVHAFLLDNGKEGLSVIDTLYDDDAHRIIEKIESIGRSVLDLKDIILTHAHRSHLGGLAKLKRRSGATVCAHEWEADIIAGEREAQRVPIFPRPPYRVYIPLQLGLALGFGSAGHLGSHVPCSVDRCLKDGDHVGPLDVIHTPGHTPGSLSFYWKEKHVLFSGDVVVSWPAQSPGWKGFTLNYRQNRDSLDRLAAYTDLVAVAVGHGPPITRDPARVVRQARDEARKWVRDG